MPRLDEAPPPLPGGGRWRLWTRAGPFLWIAPAAVPVVLPRQAGGLGRRLAADLELVRTRGIRLFN